MNNFLRVSLVLSLCLCAINFVACEKGDPLSVGNDDKTPPAAVKLVTIKKFAANPDSLEAGKNTSLTAEYENATSVEIKILSGRATYISGNIYRVESTATLQLVAHGKGSRNQDSTAYATLTVKTWKKADQPEILGNIVVGFGFMSKTGIGGDFNGKVDAVSPLVTLTIWTTTGYQLLLDGKWVAGSPRAKYVYELKREMLPRGWSEKWNSIGEAGHDSNNVQFSFRKSMHGEPQDSLAIGLGYQSTTNIGGDWTIGMDGLGIYISQNVWVTNNAGLSLDGKTIAGVNPTEIKPMYREKLPGTWHEVWNNLNQQGRDPNFVMWMYRP